MSATFLMEEPREEWTRAGILELIELYKAQDCLWNVNNISYRDKRKRCAAWKNIATSLGHDGVSIERKMKVLKTQFMHCYKLLKKYSSNGEAYQPKWFAYKSLKFLIPGKIIRENREINRMNEEGLKVIKTEPIDISVGMNHAEGGAYRMGPEVTIDPDISTENSLRAVSKQFNNYPQATSTDTTDECSRKSCQVEPGALKHNCETTIRDEFVIFGELIACRLRKIKNVRARLTLQFNITNLVFDAEMEEVDQESGIEIFGNLQENVS